MRRAMELLIAVAALLWLPWAAAGDYAIVGATLHTLTGDGTLADAMLIIEDGRISAIGRNLDVPVGAEVIDATGKVVTPGIFDPFSRLGLVEIGLTKETVDDENAGRYSAGFDVADAINPRSTLIGVNRIEGVTRALTVPRDTAEGPVIAGQAAAIHLGDSEAFLVRRRAAVVAYLGESGAELAGGSRAAALSLLREALEDAADYNRNRSEYNAGQRREYAVGRLDLEALLPVVSGRTPLMVAANRASDIEALLRFAEDFDLEMILVGGAEAWLVADRLAGAGVGVIIDPLANLPEDFETLNATLTNAAQLARAGVRIAFSISSSHNARNLTQAAGNAVAHGLPWDDALRAITLNPARMFDQDGECGTLEAGKDADVVIWSGDPLEVTTFADQVFVRGEKLSMHSRQTLLRDRYLDLDADWPPAYR